MPMLNIRVDENIKKTLQEIAKFKNITLSQLVLNATLEMIEDEFDYKFALKAKKRRKKDEPVFNMENLYEEFEV